MVAAHGRYIRQHESTRRLGHLGEPSRNGSGQSSVRRAAPATAAHRSYPFQYVPMMTAETPASLSLLDRLGAVAETLFDRSVLPTRAKGVRYVGETPWHVDSALPVASLGCLAYLQPTGPDNGALRIVPGSHHPPFNEALCDMRAARVQDSSLAGHVVATDPAT
jgi:Phytanoyl-CoA dioxygenase (PhyH)